MTGLLDLAGKPVENYTGEPSEFRLGDHVEVKETSGPYPGWTGEIVGFAVHHVGRPEKHFLMPIVKLNQGSGEKVTYYPFSIRLVDPVQALARLA